MIAFKAGGWLRQISIALLLSTFVHANPLDEGKVRAKVKRSGEVNTNLEGPDGTLLIGRREDHSVLGLRDDADSIKCGSGDNPYADQDEEEKEVPKGDPKNIYRPANEPLEIPDDKDDYGDDRFPPLGGGATPKRDNEITNSLVKRLPTALRTIKDKCFGKNSSDPFDPFVKFWLISM